MGQTTLLVKRVGDGKKREGIYRFQANRGMSRGGILPASPVLALGLALGSRPRVALSSAQASPVDSGPCPPGNSRLGRGLEVPLMSVRAGRIPLRRSTVPAHRRGQRDRY